MWWFWKSLHLIILYFNYIFMDCLKLSYYFLLNYIKYCIIVHEKVVFRIVFSKYLKNVSNYLDKKKKKKNWARPWRFSLQERLIKWTWKKYFTKYLFLFTYPFIRMTDEMNGLNEKITLFGLWARPHVIFSKIISSQN